MIQLLNLMLALPRCFAKYPTTNFYYSYYLLLGAICFKMKDAQKTFKMIEQEKN